MMSQNEFSDAALSFMKRTRIDETVAPHLISSTLFSMISRLGDYVDFIAKFGNSSEYETDPHVFVEELVGITVNSMDLKQMLWDLEYLGQVGVGFRSEPTDQGAESSWSIRGRISAILSDVYRDLLLRLVAADPHLSPQPQEGTK